MSKNRLSDHVILISGAAFMAGPLVVLVIRLVSGAEPGDLRNIFVDLWNGESIGSAPPAWQMMMNSFIIALGVAVLKCLFSILAAYALVLFRLPGRELIFGVILLSMFFPIETRILPTFAVVSDLGLLNSYTGLILPIVASGLGVLLFRLYLQQLPPELMDAARLDKAGPMRFLVDFVLPLSTPMLAALFAILFVLGWNQYVWPIMVATTSQDLDTLVLGMAKVGIAGRSGMMLALLSILPPVIVVLVLQRWLMRGLTAGIH